MNILRKVIVSGLAITTMAQASNLNHMSYTNKNSFRFTESNDKRIALHLDLISGNSEYLKDFQDEKSNSTSSSRLSIGASYLF